MNDSFIKDVDTEINRLQGLPIFRTILLLGIGVLVTIGLVANNVSQAASFGFAVVFALMWLRGKKSS